MKFLSKILKENLLLKVTSMNSISVLVRIGVGFVTQKAIAVFVGPQGMGVIGNFRDFLEGLQSFATLGISNGVIKYVAEFKKDTKKLSEVLTTALVLILSAVFLTALIIFFTASYWNHIIFSGAYGFTTVIRVAAISVPLYAMYILLVAVINGFSNYRVFIASNILSSLVVMGTTLFLLWQFKLEGALYAVLLAPVLAFVITAGFLYKKRFALQHFKVSNFNPEVVRKLSTFALMALLSSLALPAVRIAIRDYITLTDTMDAAGYWEAMNRLSNFYLMFATSLMTLYVLPKLSEITGNKEFRKEILNFYKTVLPLFFFGLLLIFLLRNFIISVLLSDEFAPMEILFAWQLTGDLFKVASMVIAYQFLAKNMFWYYVMVETASVLLVYLLSVFFIARYGFLGASIGHAVSSLIYFVVILAIFRKKLFKNSEN